MFRRHGMPAWAMSHVRHEPKNPALLAHDCRPGLYPHARAVGAFSEFHAGICRGQVADTNHVDFARSRSPEPSPRSSTTTASFRTAWGHSSHLNRLHSSLVRLRRRRRSRCDAMRPRPPSSQSKVFGGWDCSQPPAVTTSAAPPQPFWRELFRAWF
jgi:hypothetical protein